MKKLDELAPGIRQSLTLALCGSLIAGCSGVRPGMGSGQFGASWQAREAAYLQQEKEEEEDDDFGDRMGSADRRSKAKRRAKSGLGSAGSFLLGALGVGAALWLVSSLGDDDEDEELTFDDTLTYGAAAQMPGGLGKGIRR